MTILDFVKRNWIYLTIGAVFVVAAIAGYFLFFKPIGAPTRVAPPSIGLTQEEQDIINQLTAVAPSQKSTLLTDDEYADLLSKVAPKDKSKLLSNKEYERLLDAVRPKK